LKVGLFRLEKKPRIFARTLAYICHYHNIDFFYFTSNDVDIENETISGLFFENGTWVRKETNYPDVIENHPRLFRIKELHDSLSKKCVLTTYRIGSKQHIFNILEKDGRFSDILIPSIHIKEVSDIDKALNLHNHVLLKPSKSNHGKGIYTIKKTGTTYDISTDHSSKQYSKTEFEQLCNEVFLKRVYLCQPFITSKTKEGLPFDVRLNVRRNREGEWSTVKIYPKVGIGRAITSNVSQGGGISSINPFLKSQFGDQWKNVKDKLKELSKTFPPYFQEFYDSQLDALGIDLGIDSNGNLWLFEVNVFPGATYFRVEDAEKRVEYYMYCAENKDKLLSQLS